MTKEIKRNELITITATSTECSQEDVQKIIDAFLDAIIRELRIRDAPSLLLHFCGEGRIQYQRNCKSGGALQHPYHVDLHEPHTGENEGKG